jgi:beta-lactam-binding protein with PASTA domain
VVISTTPKSGTELKPGETVTVVLSKGRAPITVPNLVGMNINDAKTKLRELGLQLLERQKDSDQPADQVLAQTPKPGTGVEKNAEITLDVSLGPPQVVMPAVMQQPCQQAKATLEGMGLGVDIGGLNPNGTVFQQNPAPNTPVPAQSRVQLQCF